MGSLLLRDTGIILQWCKAQRCVLDNNTCHLLKSNAPLYNCQAVMLISTTNHWEPLLLLPCGGFGAGGQLSELALVCLKVHWDSSGVVGTPAVLLHHPGVLWCRFTSGCCNTIRPCWCCLCQVITHHEPHLDTRIICTLCYCRICSYKL